MIAKRYSRFAARVVAILLITLPIGVIISCLPDDCGGIGPYYTTVEEITSTNIRFTDGQNSALGQNDTVMYSEYAISTDILSGAVAETAESTGSWFSSAYACDPAPILVDTVVAITVFSNADYVSSAQDTIAAYESLNAYLCIGFNGSPTSFESLTSYPQARLQLAYRPFFIVRFSEAPAAPQTHEFTVGYELADGRVLSSTTAPVTVTP